MLKLKLYKQAKIIYYRRSEKYTLLGAGTKMMHPTLYVVIGLYN